MLDGQMSTASTCLHGSVGNHALLCNLPPITLWWSCPRSGSHVGVLKTPLTAIGIFIVDQQSGTCSYQSSCPGLCHIVSSADETAAREHVTGAGTEDMSVWVESAKEDFPLGPIAMASCDTIVHRCQAHSSLTCSQLAYCQLPHYYVLHVCAHRCDGVHAVLHCSATLGNVMFTAVVASTIW